jgi:secretion/DNA translocation related TadE-like protein
MTPERGSAGVLLGAVAGVILLLAALLGAVGVYLRARIEVSAAADAGALAAAPVTFLPFGAEGTPAEEAQRFARLNGTELRRCLCPVDPSWEARTVEVEVARTVRLWPAGSITVTATSRAEFVPTALLGGN